MMHCNTPFCFGEVVPYHINIPMINPTTGQKSTKTVSAMNFYSYRLMIRAQENNFILRCNQLSHQYIVDMYAKIESELFNFIRQSRARLRSEEYIHLRDAIINDAFIELQVILEENIIKN
ncbi:uncharacterized protein LOC128856408 [Anastrepha ludens]|uniref:uncharacterized protein LOC128856408 n=1 Tax=Anastrepha ludens TaxID=28586 RepID=UPI0023AF1F12|nr:uncharacterized protein LOC128856408 [Anastrepha ludens]